ncbi:MAG: helix-turn-helix domain-containing protein [bacterium]
MIFVKILTEEEQEELTLLSRRPPSACLWRRVRIIQLSAKKVSVPNIADALQMSKKKVRYWIRRYEKEGISGLYSRPRQGRH